MVTPNSKHSFSPSMIKRPKARSIECVAADIAAELCHYNYENSGDFDIHSHLKSHQQRIDKQIIASNPISARR